MSQMATEPAAPRRPQSGGNVFTHKIGPLPMWVWVASIGAIIIAWSFWKSKTSPSSQQQGNGTGQATADTADIPQFVNQTYTTVTPPSVTVGGPTVNVPPDSDSGGGFTTGTPVITPGNYKPPTSHPVTPKPTAPAATHSPIFNATYVVKKNETLASIAKRYGITREQLAHANGLGTGAGLRTGQKIRVPSPPPKGTPNKAI